MKIIALSSFIAFLGIALYCTVYFFILFLIYKTRAENLPFNPKEMMELERIIKLHPEPYQAIAELKKMREGYRFSRFHLFKTKSAYQHIMQKVQKRIQNARSTDEVELYLHIQAILLQLMDGVDARRVKTQLKKYKPINFKIHESH